MPNSSTILGIDNADLDRIDPLITSNATDGPRHRSRQHPEDPADSPEQVQWDAGEGNCAGCDCAFFLRTAAEISVMTNPIGRGSL
jgi:hypothetical protein